MPDLLSITPSTAFKSLIAVGSNTLNTLMAYEFNERQQSLTKTTALTPELPLERDIKVFTLGLATYGVQSRKLVALYGVEEQKKDETKEKSLLFGFKSANKKNLRLVLQEWVVNDGAEEGEDGSTDIIQATESSTISLHDIAALLVNMTGMLKEIKDRQVSMDKRLDKLESMFQTRD
jgi:hypothetical protein